jgi:hypothetical protein
MEIRQIKKEIDIRPASYLDENAENTEKYYLSLKCTKICCSTTSDMISFIFRFVSNYTLKKFDPLKHETGFVGHICCARTAIVSITRGFGRPANFKGSSAHS